MTSTDFRIRLIQDERGVAQLSEAWTHLLSRSNATIFASLPWNLAWWHSFGANKHPYILVATDPSGEVRGIAPLMLTRLGPLRRLEFIGTGLSDAGDFLLDADYALPAAQSIFAHLRRLRRTWDLIDLDEVPPYSPLATWLQTGKPLGQHIIRLPRTDAPYVALPPTWEEYIVTLQRKPRQHLESFAKRVIQETGMEYRCVTTPQDTPEAVARFYKLHRARWETKSDSLNPEHIAPSFLPFLEEACLRAAASGYLRISELWAGDAVISSWISFQVNNRLNGYMTGFDPAYSKDRPGKILHRFVVRQALSEQVIELDFGRGGEEYKFEMGAVHRHNARFILANNTPRSLLAFAAMKLRMRARDLIRNTHHPEPTPTSQINNKQ
jgi:CelD/BcsL family acetyltransferase involved in cellulose biosynthesis